FSSRAAPRCGKPRLWAMGIGCRSEEHTSELQSLAYLVCRLLLEKKKELRALRTAGWTQQPWLPSYSTREHARPGVPEAVFRWALEACFVIAVPVAASIADLRSLWIIAAAAGAFLIVAITEWAASRERDALPAPAPA